MMEKPSSSPYIYRPLLPAHNSIRLLRILPSSLVAAPIRCEIIDYSLSSPRRASHLYECLSYVWGSPENKQRIFVNDACLDVTRNLHSALIHLRDSDLPRVMWVDAVCIDQENLKERGQQVQFMALIYAYAAKVVVWLGEEADGSSETMKRIRTGATHRVRHQMASPDRLPSGDDGGTEKEGNREDDSKEHELLVGQGARPLSRYGKQYTEMQNLLLDCERKHRRNASESKVIKKRPIDHTTQQEGPDIIFATQTLQNKQPKAQENSQATKSGAESAGSYPANFDAAVTQLNSDAQFMALLRRPWFRRIWVLQEVAAARYVSIVCGHAEMTGTTFYLGLQSIWSHRDGHQDIRASITPLLKLLGREGFSHLPEEDTNKTFSLGIRPLPELIDMFRTHEATDCRDKVYALLGMSTLRQTLNQVSPDYELDWHTFFKRTARQVLGSKLKAKLKSSKDGNTGFIIANVCILGYVSAVGSARNDGQVIDIASSAVQLPSPYPCKRWKVHNSAIPILKGDLLCLIEGCVDPTIARLKNNSLEVIMVAINLPKSNGEDWSRVDREFLYLQERSSLRKLRLLWTWDFALMDEVGLEKSHISTEKESEVSRQLIQLSNLARAIEDVDGKNGLVQVLDQVKILSKYLNPMPTHLAIRFKALQLVVHTWDMYMSLKSTILVALADPDQGVKNGDITQPTAITTPDVLDIWALLIDRPALGSKIVSRLVKEDLYANHNFLRLALLLELWGAHIPPSAITNLETVLQKKEEEEEIHDGRRGTWFRLVISVVVRIAAKHSGWGENLLRALLEHVRHDLLQFYQLLRHAVIRPHSTSDILDHGSWLSPVVASAIGSDAEGLTRILTELHVWQYAALPPSGLDYRCPVFNFLHAKYPCLESRTWLQHQRAYYSSFGEDFMAELTKADMHEEVALHMMWEACSLGQLERVYALLRLKKAENIYLGCISQKNEEGRVYRSTLMAVALEYGHVLCYQALARHKSGLPIAGSLTTAQLMERYPKKTIRTMEPINPDDATASAIAHTSASTNISSGRGDRVWSKIKDLGRGS
ncbi:hypothetical protein K458DRAFT_208860 [Lentithecium fluviatile CBS 122367]|uniref:Heterokaryon incompatibility domain-containing protein n=1 Tax=Lentithecium fluviatile CBS 122367 TaxID=1168545 RepID=A0A6G1J6J6_9PLEO|nr:hypothetical protein K458DRAFT_208860 [Lentithecium fluviatile CBS 122367]